VTRAVPEADLPLQVTVADAVEAAYEEELGRCEAALLAGLPTLVECDKDLTPFFYAQLRDRLKRKSLRCVYLDGRAPPDAAPTAPQGVVATMIAQVRDAVRGPVGERVVVIPHLDLLTTSSGGLTGEAREVIPLLYESPQTLWLGFKDPSFPVPRVIQNLFAHRESIFGVSRERLARLVTQKESRKLGKDLDPYVLYSFVSGVNAVRLRRILGALTGEDYPSEPRHVLAQLRAATLTSSDLAMPNVDVERDIGGYRAVKDRLKREIFDVLAHKATLVEPEQIRRVEALVPRGLIFSGPPGTGKTLFAKAMATALGAAVTIVSGPELKSRWVGESEENIRQVFLRARKSAPSVIVFDELDSFAAARGTYTASGVEHSMVNQLLTEMDGFRKDELVFVVGTTNFVESLDPALLRPGRFELQLHIPYPDAIDRRAILEVHDQKLALAMSPRAVDYAVRRTADHVEGTDTRHSGDHLQALCRAIARDRLRERRTGPTEPLDVERALVEYVGRPELTGAEEKVVATHEAGHAICALLCEGAPPIDRISIRGDLGGVLGFVRYADPAHRYVVTRGQLLDSLCVLYGGREAEVLLLDDLSIGSAHDVARATGIARALVEEFGMGGDDLGVRRFAAHGHEAHAGGGALSDTTRESLERSVKGVLESQRARARRLVAENREMVVALRDLLLEKKVLDREAFGPIADGLRKKEPGSG
jgi:cell division protease FtsH